MTAHDSAPTPQALSSDHAPQDVEMLDQNGACATTATATGTQGVGGHVQQQPGDGSRDSGDMSQSRQQLDVDIQPSAPVLPTELLPSNKTPMASLGSQRAPTGLHGQEPVFSFVGVPSDSTEAQAIAPTNITLPGQRKVTDEAGWDREVTNQSIIPDDAVLGESGRTYHGYKEGKYYFPNDPDEQDRLDLQHHVLTLALDGNLFLAPMTKVPEYVIDVATGTGIWACDFSQQFPMSKVIATDLSAIQPKDNDLPNVVFQKDDAEDPWVFRKEPPANAPIGSISEEDLRIRFDYVHLRQVITCFDDTRTVMKHAFDNMNPGGWIEFQDMSFEILQANPEYPRDALQRWSKLCQKGAAAMGRDIKKVKYYAEWLRETGFVDVQQRQMILPSTPWPASPQLQNIGTYHFRNVLDGLSGLGYVMLKAAGLQPAEIEQLTQEAKTELPHRRNHTYTPFYVVYGRKPMDGEELAPPTGPQ